jgi:hydrogenase maturation protease
VDERRTLVLGYGNPGRQDDGLGPAAAEAIEAMQFAGVETSANYQLVIEDASAAAESGHVLFIDASKTADAPFTIEAVVPAVEVSCFASHVVPPEFIMGLCREIYGCTPPAHVVGIRGYEFEFCEGLTERALANLALALAHLRLLLVDRAAFTL